MKRKILIVEDNSDCRELLARYMQHLGHEPMEAQNGHEAITLAVNGQPDLIFVDIGLPDMNGVEVTARLKQDFETSQIPIVIFTAWPPGVWKEKALNAGAADYLLKPASAEVVRRVIERFTRPNSMLSQSGQST
ncbi:MAG TPA: response regulator [Terriglobales bacterium]|nr:response regulator [Terriglobales bacterium]